MDLHVNLTDRRDLAGQIYRQIRSGVLDGLLRPGETLPPTRELAARLAVSRNTVSAAYDRLTAEGFLTTRVGAGTFVAAGLFAGPSAEGRARARRPARPPRPRAVWGTIPESPLAMADAPEFDFRAGSPDARLFPYQAWRRLLTREVSASAVPPGAHGDPAGHPALRAAIARHVGVSRAVPAGADDVIVTAGAQQALDLVARVLLAPGDTAAVEDPGYPPPRWLLATQGVRVAAVPVDAEGLVVDAIPAGARMVHVTPSHQFPLGLAMSLERRMALLAWAERQDAVIVEDDYDSEFRYGGRPIEPLHSLDRGGRVVYVGSFSKVLLPSLRLGFLVAPPSLREALRTARHIADLHGPLAEQGALAGLIDEGLLARHIRRMRGEYRRRHEHIGRVLARDFAEILEVVPSAAGLHLSALLPEGTDDRAVVARAREAGVGLLPLSDFFAGRGRPGLLLGYGAIAPGRIEEGLARLRKAL
ncbi:PLP-dependent aminotransferase family protein [Actinomadura scrupuli]|uniref:MocR-like pyridoxine biosynthesis transcription factor PdxR n=1 Tax=Actinomadura scrupuli TaxID=559629 RepID=UPI003D993D4C